jgi:phage terminase large subunit-like protein
MQTNRFSPFAAQSTYYRQATARNRTNMAVKVRFCDEQSMIRKSLRTLEKNEPVRFLGTQKFHTVVKKFEQEVHLC